MSPRNRFPAPILPDADSIERIRREYARRFGVRLYAVDAEGRLLEPDRPPCPVKVREECVGARRLALNEARRWGEPTILFCPGRRLLWAVPLMINDRIVGGLVASTSEREAFVGVRGKSPVDAKTAAAGLLEIAERENLVNAAALREERRRHREEQQRAYAIHTWKSLSHTGIRELYLKEEPALFSAIRSGDRASAREILNRILLEILRHSGTRLEVSRSFFMELVVSMCRTAVDAGGNPEELLGANYRRMTELAAIRSEGELAAWIRRTLDHLMDTIRISRQKDTPTALMDAISWMERHLGEKISRDDAARAAYLSPSHFSTLLRRESGATFTELLNRMRVDRAAELLARSDKPLALVALETGFRDQSYFTKVFRRYRRLSPLRYRRQLGGTKTP